MSVAIPNTMSLAARAARRFNTVRAVEFAARGAAVGLGLGLAGIAAQKLSIWPWTTGSVWWVPLTIGAAAGVGAGAARAWFGRWSREQAARALDERLGLKDRVGSALALSHADRDDPFIALASRDAEALSARVSPAAAAPVPRRRWWVLIPILSAVGVVAGLWVPTLRRPANEASAAADAQAEDVAKRIAEASRTLTPGPSASAAPVASPAELQELEDLQRELRGEKPDPQAAAAKAARTLEHAADQRQRLAERQAAENSDLRRRLAKAARDARVSAPTPDSETASAPSSEPAALEDLTRALEAGDLDAAAHAARSLAQDAPSMPDAQREQLMRELGELAEKLEAAEPVSTAEQPDNTGPGTAEPAAQGTRTARTPTNPPGPGETKPPTGDAPTPAEPPTKAPDATPPPPPEPTRTDRDPSPPTPPADQRPTPAPSQPTDGTNAKDTPTKNTTPPDSRRTTDPEAQKSDKQNHQRDAEPQGRQQSKDIAKSLRDAAESLREKRPDGEADRGPGRSESDPERTPSDPKNPPASTPEQAADRPTDPNAGSKPSPPASDPSGKPRPEAGRPTDRSPNSPGTNPPQDPSTPQPAGSKPQPAESRDRADPEPTSRPEPKSGSPQVPSPDQIPDSLSPSAMKALEKLAEQFSKAAEDQQLPKLSEEQARQLREKAQKILESASPEQKRRLEELARRAARQGTIPPSSPDTPDRPIPGMPPNTHPQPGEGEPRGRSGDSPPPSPADGTPGQSDQRDETLGGNSDREPSDAASNPGGTGAGRGSARRADRPRTGAPDAPPFTPGELIDARPRGEKPGPREPETVISQWDGPGSRGAAPDAPSRAAESFRAAAAGAEKAVEQQVVPARYGEFVKRVFKRYVDRATAKPGTPTERPTPTSAPDAPDARPR